MRIRLPLLLLALITLASCTATPTPVPPLPNTPAPVLAPTLTPTAASGSNVTVLSRYDPTTKVITIYGTTPGATVVLADNLRLPPPTSISAAATATPNSTATETRASLPPKLATSAPLATAAPSATSAPRATTIPPPVVSSATLRGKIMFKSARGGGKYPDTFGYYVMDPNGQNQRALSFAAAQPFYNSLLPYEGYAPDLKRVVVGEAACNNAPCSLYILDPVTNPGLVRNQGKWFPATGYRKAVDPVWSPDGSWIAFVGNWENDRTANIFKGSPGQTPPTFQRLTDFFAQEADTHHPSYSPDGSALAFATSKGGHWQVWVLNPNGSDPAGASPHNISLSDSADWDPLWVK